MEENKKHEIDAFLRKQLQEISLESPSKKFTSNIMDVIEKEEVSVITKYKPLISKKVWFAAAAVIVAILFIPFKKQEGGMLENISIDFSFLEKISISGLLDGFDTSHAAIYGAILFAVMISIQVVYLKGYFSRRISAGL